MIRDYRTNTVDAAAMFERRYNRESNDYDCSPDDIENDVDDCEDEGPEDIFETLGNILRP